MVNFVDHDASAGRYLCIGYAYSTNEALAVPCTGDTAFSATNKVLAHYLLKENGEVAGDIVYACTVDLETSEVVLLVDQYGPDMEGVHDPLYHLDGKGDQDFLVIGVRVLGQECIHGLVRSVTAEKATDQAIDFMDGIFGDGNDWKFIVTIDLESHEVVCRIENWGEAA